MKYTAYLLVALVGLLCSFKPDDPIRLRFDYSKTDCSTDDAKFHLIVYVLDKVYTTEYNSFTGRIDDKFSHYIWKPWYAPATRCENSYFLWVYEDDAIKLKILPLSATKKFDPTTTFKIRVTTGDGPVHTIEHLELKEERKMQPPKEFWHF